MSKECSKFSSMAKAQNPLQTRSGSFYIKRPRRTDDGETEYEVVPIESPSTRAYLKAIFGPLTSRGFVTDAEFRTIIEMIKGIAIEQPFGELSDCGAETIQQKPLLHALILLANSGPFRDTPVNLLAKVNTELRLNGIVIDDPSFPTTEDAFGRQLALLKEDAAKLGLILQRNETDRPRTWSGYLAEDAPPPRDGRDGDVADGSPARNETNGDPDTSSAADTHRRVPLALPYTPPAQVPGLTLSGQPAEVVELETEGDRS